MLDSSGTVQTACQSCDSLTREKIERNKSYLRSTFQANYLLPASDLRPLWKQKYAVLFFLKEFVKSSHVLGNDGNCFECISKQWFSFFPNNKKKS